MIKTRDGFWVAAALAIAVGACSKSKAAAGGGGGAAGGAPMGLPVEVVVARMDTVRDEISATGQIEAVQSIDLRPEVDGRIVEIVIREGQEVEQGTPLFKVDDAQLRAQVAQLASLHTVNPQRATFQVPERFARQLRPGQQVSFRVAAIAGRDFTGEVDFVDP